MTAPKRLPLQTRTVAVEVIERGERSATGAMTVSISSETPVPRFFGREVLSHKASAIDLSYAKHGLPLLKDHDTREQVGILENVRVRNGRLVGEARPGNHPDATWIFADMRAGVRPHMSLGYRVNSMRLIASDPNGDTYEVDSWTPVEGSTVPVPADVTVGVGRSAHETQYPVAVTTHQRSHMPDNLSVERDYEAEARAYREQMSNLAKAGNASPQELADAIRRGDTADQFARQLQDKAVASAARLSSVTTLSDREQKEYSVLRAFRAAIDAKQGDPRAWDRAGFERELSDEIARRAPASNGGFFIPLTLNTRAAVTGQTAGTSSLGGAGVQTTIMSMIELLRNQMVVRQLGARVLTGLTANITFPRQITANSVTWTGENPSTGNANTNATFDTVTMTPKTAMVSTAASRQLLVQMSEDAESLVREDLSRVVAIELDRVAINGSGASNQPRGLFQTTGVSTVTTTFGTNGAVPDWAAVVDFETTLANSNAPTSRPWRWLTTPGIRGKLKQVLQNTVSGASWIWDGDRMAGYQALVSNQVPSNFTHGTSTTICHGMALGNWAELLIGEWGGGIEILVDPYTVASQNMVQFHAFLMADVALRHGASFAVAKSAKTS